MPPLQLFDSSVLIPWLRTRHHDALVTTAFASRRFLLSPVVWMELYAGTRSRGDKQDLDRIVRALTGIGRVVSPEPEDFCTAGQVVATYTCRYGQTALRDHAHDILIALEDGALVPSCSRSIARIWNGGNGSSVMPDCAP